MALNIRVVTKKEREFVRENRIMFYFKSNRYFVKAENVSYQKNPASVFGALVHISLWCPIVRTKLLESSKSIAPGLRSNNVG